MGNMARYTPDGPPADFPSSEFAELRRGLASVHPPTELLFSGEWYGTSQALVHRFCALAEHDEDFTESVRIHGPVPPNPHRYIQQRELFEFFENGHAVLETFHFTAYMLGAAATPERFPLSSEQDRKKVNPSLTRDRFREVFPDSPLARHLLLLADDPQQDEWRKIRGVLAHRLAPNMAIYVPMTLPDGTKTPVSPPEWNSLPPGIKLIIDDQTTADRRAWLAKTLTVLVRCASDFVNAPLAGRGSTVVT
jgi:hypothetical protein